MSVHVKGTFRGIKIVYNYRTDLDNMIYLRAFIFHPKIHADKRTEKKDNCINIINYVNSTTLILFLNSVFFKFVISEILSSQQISAAQKNWNCHSKKSHQWKGKLTDHERVVSRK